MRITENFTMNEVLKSNTADRLMIDNRPTQAVKRKLKLLVKNCLQPIRDQLGKPITVTSGYRSQALNKAIKGSRASQHMLGEAVDVECFSLTTREFFDFIKGAGVEYDKLILEFHNPDEPNSGWVHLSWRAGNNRMQSFEIN